MNTILYISHRIPYPPNKGDKIRTFNEIRYLSKKFKIDLVSFADNPADMKHVEDLKSYCRNVFIYPLSPLKGKIKGFQRLASGRTISEGYFFNAAASRKVGELIGRYDYKAIFCFSSPTAEYVIKNFFLIDKKRIKPRLIMDFCDVDSVKWGQYSKTTNFPLNWIYKTESKRLLAYEKKINKMFDASVFVSQNETQLFKMLFPEAINLFSVSNGVDTKYFSSNQNRKTSNKKKMMFAGAMDYYANIEGVTWFCKEILPHIKKRIPELEFYIVGNNPSSEIKALENNHITVTGFVEDIRAYYAKADLCVIPLRIARGIQNKLLEAMAMSKPVVTTTVAFSGIGAKAGKHLLLADEASFFVESACKLLENPKKATAIGLEARAFVETEFSWNAKLRELDKLF